MRSPVDLKAANAWDAEYAAGRHGDETPVAFVTDDVVAADVGADQGVCIGCGNGRNYVPLTATRLDLIPHGTREQFLGAALDRVGPGGLFCLRVNVVGTDVLHAYEVIERDPDGSYSVCYAAGRKLG